MLSFSGRLVRCDFVVRSDPTAVHWCHDDLSILRMRPRLKWPAGDRERDWKARRTCTERGREGAVLVMNEQFQPSVSEGYQGCCLRDPTSSSLAPWAVQAVRASTAASNSSSCTASSNPCSVLSPQTLDLMVVVLVVVVYSLTITDHHPESGQHETSMRLGLRLPHPPASCHCPAAARLLTTGNVITDRCVFIPILTPSD